AEDGIRDFHVTGVQTCALPIYQSVGMHRLRRVRTRMPGRSDSARYRRRPGAMARAERALFGRVAEHHPEEGSTRRRRRLQGRRRQIRPVLLAGGRRRRLSFFATWLTTASAENSPPLPCNGQGWQFCCESAI